MKPTAQQIIENVRKLATENPNNVYNRPEGADSCYYHRGECLNGTIGCIVGQAVAMIPDHGLDMSLVESVVFFLHHQGVVMTNDERVWFEHIQAKQDCGHIWSEALKMADAAVPALAPRSGVICADGQDNPKPEVA